MYVLRTYQHNMLYCSGRFCVGHPSIFVDDVTIADGVCIDGTVQGTNDFKWFAAELGAGPDISKPERIGVTNTVIICVLFYHKHVHTIMSILIL